MMKTTISVELFGPQGNNAVIQLPLRKNPGVLVQGDTLRSIISQVEAISECIESNDFVEAREELRFLHANLAEMAAAIDYYSSR